MSSLMHASRLARVLSATRAAFPAHTLAARTFASYPADRKYVISHEWAKLDGDVATIGISSHAQAELGDIVHADLPEVGGDATAGTPAAAVESVKAAADIYSPISGEVIEVNGSLEAEPELINKEPHDNGWLFKVKVSDPSGMDALMSSSDYEATLDKE